MYIYCITNTINSKKYVGLTIHPISESSGYYGSGRYITRVIKKYGKEHLGLFGNIKENK